jgi:hypothetical protein
MTILLTLTALALLVAIVLWPRPAWAHCDTEDGPAVAAGRRALETGNVNHAVVWVPEEAETELRAVFTDVITVRELSDDAARVADRLFLETLVRLHRAGEGAPFEGLKSGGTTDPVVAAADRAIAVGRIEPLVDLVEPDRLPELERRLATALALRDHDVDDVAAGRRHLAAYVAFVTLAEGHEHAHAHEHQHEHGADTTVPAGDPG